MPRRSIYFPTWEIGDAVMHKNAFPGEAPAFVIGYPHYSPDGRVVVIASPDHVGMPINAAHLCAETAKSHPLLILMYQQRYLETGAKLAAV